MNAEFLKPLRLCVLAILVAAMPAAGQDEDDDFTPRTGTPPASRTGGASRGGSSDKDAPSVSALAPADTLGLTSREQPVIYWYLSHDTEVPIELVITDPTNKEEPLLETRLEGVKKAGLHKLDLAHAKLNEKAVKLRPGLKYEVVIEIAGDAAQASRNPNATFRLMRVDPKDAPPEVRKEKDPAKRAVIAGKAGLWFDYIDALNTAIDADPADEKLVQKRTRALAAQRLVWLPDGTITELSEQEAKTAK